MRARTGRSGDGLVANAGFAVEVVAPIIDAPLFAMAWQTDLPIPKVAEAGCQASFHRNLPTCCEVEGTLISE